MGTKYIIVTFAVVGFYIFTTDALIEYKVNDILKNNKQSVTDNTIMTTDSKYEDNYLVFDQSIAVLKEEVYLLTQQVFSLQELIDKQQNTNTEDFTSNTQISDELIKTDSVNVETEFYSASKDRAEQMDYYHSLLESEPIDPSWSLSAEQTINDAFYNQDLSGSQPLHVECRSTVCRAEIEHNSAKKSDLFNLHFASKVSAITSNGRMEQVELLDGRQKTVIYLAREGYNLPNE